MPKNCQLDLGNQKHDGKVMMQAIPFIHAP